MQLLIEGEPHPQFDMKATSRQLLIEGEPHPLFDAKATSRAVTNRR